MDTDPCVPTSDQPPKPEWTCHFWYVLRAFALQARPDIATEDAASLVALFANLAAGLPCAKCKAHYKENFAARPYTLGHATDPAKGLQWIADLRQRIKEQIAQDASAAGGRDTQAAPSKFRSCVPRPPKAAYGGMESRRGPTDTAARLEQRAHAAALARTAQNHAKGDCGCSAKEPELAKPKF